MSIVYYLILEDENPLSRLFQLVNNKVITEAEGAGQAKIPIAEFCAKLKSYNKAESRGTLPQTA